VHLNPKKQSISNEMPKMMSKSASDAPTKKKKDYGDADESKMNLLNTSLKIGETGGGSAHKLN
jgi:hypothetical protein